MIIVVMGVSGSGKTTIGKLLANRLGWPFRDADDFHSPANVEKMRRGIPLDDDDRAEWLKSLASLIACHAALGRPLIVACSALKQRYRDILQDNAKNVRFVYLRGDYDLIRRRMQARRDHFMKAGMLKSQFQALDEPADALAADASLSPREITAKILDAFSLEEKK